MLPTTVAATIGAIAMTVAAISITISITADTPTTAIAVTNKAYLVSLYAASIDGAKLVDWKCGSRSRQPNREGGRGKR